MSEDIENLFFLDSDSHPICLVPGVEYEVVRTVICRPKYGERIEQRYLLRENRDKRVKTH